MGYQCIHIRSKRLRDQMLAFLNQNARSTLAILGLDDPDGRPLLAAGETVCTYAGQNEIGCYVTAGWGPEDRAAAASLLRWVALRVGKVTSVDDDEIPGQAAMKPPYVCYDGAHTPIVVREVYQGGWEAEGYEGCDNLGWAPSYSGPAPGQNGSFDAGCGEHVLRLRQRKAAFDPLLREELARLDALWEQVKPSRV